MSSSSPLQSTGELVQLPHRELDRLVLVLQHADPGLWVFCLYNEITVQRTMTDILQERIASVPLFTLLLNPDRSLLAELDATLPTDVRQERCVLVVQSVGGWARDVRVVRYLEVYREHFMAQPYVFLFWVREEEREHIAREAPNFYFRHAGLFDFRTLGPRGPLFKSLALPILWQDREDLLAAERLYLSLLAEYEKDEGTPDKGVIADLLHTLGTIYLAQGRFPDAKRFFERHHGLAQELGDEQRLARSHLGMGDLALREDRLAEARAHYEAALAIYPAIGARLGEANVLQALGDLALREARLAEARAHYEAALAIYPAIGDRLGEANVRAALGRLALHEGDEKRARRLLEEAVRLHRAIGDTYSVAADLGNFGLELLRLGRPDESRPLLLRAAYLFQELGFTHHTLQLLKAAFHPAVARLAPLLLGVVAVAKGQAGEGEAHLVRDALGHLGRTEDWRHLASALLRVLAGERDWEALARRLDEVDRQALGLVQAALESQEAALAALEALAGAAGEGASQQDESP